MKTKERILLSMIPEQYRKIFAEYLTQKLCYHTGFHKYEGSYAASKRYMKNAIIKEIVEEVREIFQLSETERKAEP